MTMITACVSTPVSWLRLELYQLGELADVEAREIKDHLHECPACRQCAAETEKPIAVDLERPATAVVSIADARRKRLAKWSSGFAAAVTAAAAAWLLIPRAAIEEAIPGHELRIKGGDVAVSLVRERDGATLNDPEKFALGDRFKVLLTCPPGLADPQEVVVFQNGEASFPLRARAGAACGNRVSWEGAFRFTESLPATVCIVWGDEATTVRERPGLRHPSSLGESVVCRSLEPISE